MTKNKRVAFFISDGTGITAGSLGGLLAHFPETEFEQIRIPYTNNSAKIEDAQKADCFVPSMHSVQNLETRSVDNKPVEARTNTFKKSPIAYLSTLINEDSST